MCVGVCVCVREREQGCVYIYVCEVGADVSCVTLACVREREREGGKERERKRGCVCIYVCAVGADVACLTLACVRRD